MTDPDPLVQARAACLCYLARREYCQSELIEKLLGKGCDEAVARQAVGDLARDGLQSDRRFLDSFVRGRVAKGYGEARIRQELRFRGVDLEDAAEVLREYDWDELLAEVFRKRFGRAEAATPKEKAAQFRFLQQRGFTASAVNSLLRRLRRDHDD